MTYALYNGKLIPRNQALIPIEKKEVLFSYGVYESLKVKKGIPLFLEEHIERFMESARIMELDHPFQDEEIIRGIYRLIEGEEIEEATIRLQMYGGEKPFYYAFPSPLQKYSEGFYQKGIDVISYPGERFIPAAKSNCLLLNFIAQREAAKAGAVEALLLNHAGDLLEGSRSNIFALLDTTLVTPGEGVLQGVTRKHIIEYWIQSAGIVEYRPLSLDDVLNRQYTGLYISSTSMGMVPVVRCDGKEIARSDARQRIIQVARKINEALKRREREYVDSVPKTVPENRRKPPE